MAARSKTTKTQAKRRAPASGTRRSVRKNHQTKDFLNFYLPVVFIICIFACIGVLLFWGYKTVTASSFFDVRRVDVRGAAKVPKEDVEKIVLAKSGFSGAWNADLDGIKAGIEALPFVKHAVVSRSLPDGIRVKIAERSQAAIVRATSGEYWVDEEGVSLGGVSKNDSRLPFVLRGWDEERSEKSARENIERIKIYRKLLDEFQKQGLANRVNSVNLEKIEDVQVVFEDSGAFVSAAIGKEDFAARLRRAIEAVDGQGSKIESVVSRNGGVVTKPRNS